MPRSTARATAVTAPRHVLLATTGRPIESALAPTSFHEQFVAAVAPGLRLLQAAGVRVELRLHPIEDRAVYRRILASAGLELPFAPAVGLADALRATDLVVAAPSSVAFEAGVLGVPVLLWTGGIPHDVRVDHLLAPLSLDLEGMFADEGDFAALVRGLLGDGAPGLAAGGALGARLAEYAEPFDADRFAGGLEELAG
jgi:CDP-glycerol glycerophosphotransferase (TagB/SpsB family)